MGDEAVAQELIILNDLRSKLRETSDDDTPVAAMVEQKKKWVELLTNKLNACTSSLPNPDENIVRQIAIFAELQVRIINYCDSRTSLLPCFLATHVCSCTLLHVTSLRYLFLLSSPLLSSPLLYSHIDHFVLTSFLV